MPPKAMKARRKKKAACADWEMADANLLGDAPSDDGGGPGVAGDPAAARPARRRRQRRPRPAEEALGFAQGGRPAATRRTRR